MRVFAINICPDLSTGNLMMSIANQLQSEGDTCLTAAAPKYSDERDADYVIGTVFERHIHIVLGQLLGSEASFSNYATYKLIRKIEQFDPDIIHIHNIHQYYINLSIFYSFLKNFHGKVIWTFHDCWPYTGACHHYIEEQCFKWQTRCEKCPYQRKQKIKPLFYSARYYFQYKRKHLADLNNLIIVTPSTWLADEVKKSFYKDLPIYTISNGIDTNIFRYRLSKLKQEYKLENKNIVLGVASHWSKNKGLSDFEKLSTLLDESFVIVLIGIGNCVSRKNNILFLPRTTDRIELANWYSVADVYCNLSTEETFGLVVAEAMACGTPVIVYNSTALPEIVSGTNSYICEPHDLDDVVQKIKQAICNGRDYYSELNRNKVLNLYDSKNTAKKYTTLYKNS